MAKKSAPLQEVARLLDLVPYISTHSHVSISELASEFGVSEKEMFNELTSLSMCGLPGYTPYELIEVYYETGFVTISNHETLNTPRALTSTEVATLILGLELLRESLSADNPSRAADIDALLIKMKSLVGDVVEVQENFSPLHLSIINKAIASRSAIEIEYLGTLDSNPEKRVVEPLEIYNQHGKSYLSAHCRRANALRNFRIDRIASISQDVSSATSQVSSTTNEPDRTAIEISIVRNRRHLQELFSLEPSDISESIALPIYSYEWATKAIVSNAGDIEIKAPEDLRHIVRSSLSNILALYRS